MPVRGTCAVRRQPRSRRRTDRARTVHGVATAAPHARRTRAVARRAPGRYGAAARPPGALTRNCSPYPRGGGGLAPAVRRGLLRAQHRRHRRPLPRVRLREDGDGAGSNTGSIPPSKRSAKKDDCYLQAGLLVACCPRSGARSDIMTISGSAAELLARASSRERVMPADARSGAVFERIVVGPDRDNRGRRSAPGCLRSRGIAESEPDQPRASSGSGTRVMSQPRERHGWRLPTPAAASTNGAWGGSRPVEPAVSRS